ncbi:MAG: phytanoyl-CoA dioxygenase, partial [Verrucomicrobiaceae bacterium]
HPLDQQDPSITDLLFGETTMEFYQGLFGTRPAHFDFTWFRTKGTGHGSDVHCDVVYMGRGSKKLLTMWTPLGDIDPRMGGLTILEGSHRRSDLLAGYLDRDVDEYCTNREDASAYATGVKGWNGSLSKNPLAIQNKFQARWLTSPEFRMGDALIFGMTMVHGSLDNQTELIRLSVDNRYQPADEPIDPRWVGEKVIGHSPPAKVGVIC